MAEYTRGRLAQQHLKAFRETHLDLLDRLHELTWPPTTSGTNHASATASPTGDVISAIPKADIMEPAPDPTDDATRQERLSVGDPLLGKSRLLSRQCDTCIFAPGNRMHLGPGQLRALVTQALRQGSYIICHDTLPHYLHSQAKPAICRGFADRYRTQALELIERLWGFVEIDPPQAPEAPPQGTR